MGDAMKLAIAIAFLLASSLTAQAQHSGSKHSGSKTRSLGDTYGAAAGPNNARSNNAMASNASYAGRRAQPTSPYDTFAGGGNVNPWNDRTCY